MKKDINLFCSCGCGNGLQIILRLDEDDHFAYINTLASGFYTEQRSIWKTIMHRIKAAWFMLRGKEFYLHEILITKYQWNDFVKAVNEVKL